MASIKAHVEVPSRPIRLDLWRRFRRWLFALRRVLPRLPGMVRDGWRNAGLAWKLGHELAAVAQEIRAERDMNDTPPELPAGLGLSGPSLAGARGSRSAIDAFAADARFMLQRAGDAVKDHELFGRGCLVVNFRGEPLQPFSEVYLPLPTLEQLGVGAVILGPVRRYDPVSEAVVILSGAELVKACLVGVERIGRPVAQG